MSAHWSRCGADCRNDYAAASNSRQTIGATGDAMLRDAIKRTFATVGWPMLLMSGRRPGEPRVAVVMYHSVGGGAAMSFAPSVFARHLDALQSATSCFATVGDVADAATISDSTICLTFDDGFADNHAVIFPLLAERGIRATFFVCSGFVNRRVNISARFVNYRGLSSMRWEQVRELAAAGMEIGCHTLTHPILAALSADEQEREMVDAKHEIENQVGKAVVSLAIPFGRRGTYTAETLDIAACHFKACCTTRFSTNPAQLARYRGMAVLDRVEPRPTHSERHIRAQVRGRWDSMRWIQRRFRDTES